MGITVLENTIKSATQNGRRSLIPYVMIGDGGLDNTMAMIDLYVKSGASVLELGLPFSDPVADGATIQAAGKRALEENLTLDELLGFVGDVKRKHQVPVVLMTYLNPIINYGIERFVDSLKSNSVNGIIIPDLPLEEWDLLYPQLQDNKIALVPLVTLTTNEERLQKMCNLASGFIYTVSFNGVTGSKQAEARDIADLVSKIKAQTEVPVIAGFGISYTAQIQDFYRITDGVIVASELIRYAQLNEFEKIEQLIRSNS